MLNPYDYYITPEEYEIAKANGICSATLEDRIRRLVWDKEQAISMAPRKQRRIDKRFIKIAKENGISERAFYHRLKSGWSIEDAATIPLMTRSQIGKMTKEKNKKYIDRLFLNRKKNVNI